VPENESPDEIQSVTMTGTADEQNTPVESIDSFTRISVSLTYGKHKAVIAIKTATAYVLLTFIKSDCIPFKKTDSKTVQQMLKQSFSAVFMLFKNDF